MDFEQITYQVQNRIALITLNRPDQLNAWTVTMKDEVISALGTADADDDVRVVVVTGAGEKPHWPVTTVVTPCSKSGASTAWWSGRGRIQSAWECTSMKPGATIRANTTTAARLTNFRLVIEFSPS